MENSYVGQKPTSELIVRIIEEALWCGEEGSDDAPSASDVEYLQRNVFPTLVPALYEAARQEQRLLLSQPTQIARHGATGETDPVTWLAHYLLRNNALIESSKLRNHPNTVVSHVKYGLPDAKQ